MARPRASCRLPWLAWLALAALLAPLSGCRSAPVGEVAISPVSSLLVVDVRFPVALRQDPALVQVFLVRGPIHGSLKPLPELVPASFVKRSRAYWLDPEPGTYSLVAVTSSVAPSWNDAPVAGGVTRSVSGGSLPDAVIFPAELIDRTRTTVAPGRVAFMGVLRVERGERINADAVFQDHLQKRLAERLRPQAASESGVAGWFTATWMPDLEGTTLSDAAEDRQAFFDAAREDLGASPWAEVVARAAAPEAPAARARRRAPRARTPTATAPSPTSTAPQTAAPSPRSAAPNPQTQSTPQTQSPPETESPAPVPEAAPRSEAPSLHAAFPEPEPEVPPPSPEPQRVLDLPPDSPFAELELGMSHEEVREILGEPDGRRYRLTAKAWIPFYTGPGTHLVDWVYEGKGHVVFSLHQGSLSLLDVVQDPNERK